LLFSMLCAMVLVSTSCDDDDPDGACDSLNATYDGAVKAVINSSCATIGCHNGQQSAVIPSGSEDYTSYSGMQSMLNASKFGKRVLTDKTMPPGSSELTSVLGGRRIS